MGYPPCFPIGGWATRPIRGQPRVRIPPALDFEKRQMVHRLLNVSFALLLLTLGIQFVDFLIGAQTKTKLDAFIETVTLHLSYLNTAGWFQHWLLKSRQARLSEKATTPAVVIFCLMFAAGGAVFGYRCDTPALAVPLFALLGGVAFIFLWGSIGNEILERLREPLLDRLAQCNSLREFAVTYIAAMLIGLLFICFAFGAGLYIGSNGLLAGPVLVPIWLAIFLDGLIVFIGIAVLSVFRVVISIARFCTWKIATFPRGPTAALTVLLSAAVVILKFVFHQ
jgi:hypothetical protein